MKPKIEKLMRRKSYRSKRETCYGYRASFGVLSAEAKTPQEAITLVEAATEKWLAESHGPNFVVVKNHVIVTWESYPECWHYTICGPDGVKRDCQSSHESRQHAERSARNYLAQIVYCRIPGYSASDIVLPEDQDSQERWYTWQCAIVEGREKGYDDEKCRRYADFKTTGFNPLNENFQEAKS